MQSDAIKVGEIAKRTGLTIRTLHHYDQIGLIRPSLRSNSGHRLYTVTDLSRLQQVLSLRQLGMTLEEIRECMHKKEFAPAELIRVLISRLREQVEAKRKLCERLVILERRLDTSGRASANDFLKAIQAITMVEKHYTTEQLDYLKGRARELGQKRVAKAQEEWSELIADVRTLIANGTPPTSREARALARRWRALLSEFSGGNSGIEVSNTALWKKDGDLVASQYGIDDERFGPTMQQCIEYIAKAWGTKKQE